MRNAFVACCHERTAHQVAVVVGLWHYALLYCSIQFKLYLKFMSLCEKPNCRIVFAFTHPKVGTKLNEVPLPSLKHLLMVICVDLVCVMDTTHKLTKNTWQFWLV
jgi:hypothetical protein